MVLHYLRIALLGALAGPHLHAQPQADARDEVRPDRVVVGERTHEGRVLRLDDDKVVLLEKRRVREWPRESVEKVESLVVELPKALDRLASMRSQDRDAYLAEAARLEQVNLPLEADLLYWQVLGWNPQNALAHDALGHRRQGTRYMLPWKGRWAPFDQVQEQRADWGDAWEFSTSHFDLRTNLPLDQALEAAFALERGYRAFFEEFRDDFGLVELTEPMEVFLHADEASYREPGGGRRAYYSLRKRRLSIDASRGFLDYRLLMRELTHQLLVESSIAAGGGGELPGWLVAGLAQYLESAVDLQSKAPAIDGGRANARLFATHALAPEPYRLGRVLTLDESDFWSSSRMGLKYAQAYTLVHFCVRSGDGRWRTSFAEYVRGAFRGKGSSTHFKKALGLDERDLELAWTAYASSATRSR